MPALTSLSKKLIPSKLRRRRSVSNSTEDSPEPEIDTGDVQFDVPTPDHSPTREIAEAELGMTADDGVDKEEIARLVAEYGSSSNTSWLEFSRYKIWVADKDIPPSSFRPVQGYLRSDPYVFAWGNPLVSDPAALEQTCLEFWKWCEARKLKILWCCVDDQMQKLLGEGSKFSWTTMSCIVEDVLEPHNVVELAHGGGGGGGSGVKDFKKNIRRAKREGVEVHEVPRDGWKDEEKREIEEGIVAWKKAKSGMQLASTSFQPWVDAEHRRYWVAKQDGKIVGVLVLSMIGGGQYQIKNAASFPDAPRGTSEFLIYSTMCRLDDEDASSEDGGPMVWDDDRARSPTRNDDSTLTSRDASRDGDEGEGEDEDSSENASVESANSDQPQRVTVTFGITASESMTLVDNVGGWRVSWLSKTYSKVVGATGITRRGDFRNKFNAEHIPMYVCYPSKQSFGIDGVSKLMKCLRQ